jgi:hypothetical protein
LLTIAASPGTNSSINRGELCQSDYATKRINDSFCTLVLAPVCRLKLWPILPGRPKIP